jgi:pyruvate dehydrogenase E1 component beta subunit
MGPALESFKKTFKAVIVEEGYRSFGIGAEIAARLQEEAFDYMDAPIKRVAQLEVPLPYSQELEQSALINPEKVIIAVKEVL